MAAAAAATTTLKLWSENLIQLTFKVSATSVSGLFSQEKIIVNEI